jgi:hypothetical protein
MTNTNFLTHRRFLAESRLKYRICDERSVKRSGAGLARVIGDALTFAARPGGRYRDSLDSFDKARLQIPPLLESLGIAATPENIAGAAALSRAGADVNESNARRAAEIIEKLRLARDALSPGAIARMFAEAFDPSRATAGGILDYAGRFVGATGDSGSDPSRSVTETAAYKNARTQTGITAVYRMFNTILGYDAAAVGMCVKHSFIPTLGNLLEAAGNFAKTGGAESEIDVTVGDGVKEIGVSSGIKDEIRAAIAELKQAGS